MRNLFASLLTAACLLLFAPAAMAWTTIYEATFTGSNEGWQNLYSSTSDGNTPYYYGLGVRVDDGGSTATCCQIYRDLNHTSPGIGQVGFLAYNTAAGIGLGSFTDWEGVRVTLRVRTATGFTLPAGSRIHWWMQRADPDVPGVMWNMAYSGVAIDEELGFGNVGSRYNPRTMETGWTDISFILTPDWRDWTCYGGRPDKTFYQCPLTPAEFLDGVMTNFGIHFVRADAAPMINTVGEFRISTIRFETP